jgi:sec-independent protein translocase protein TatA
MPNVGPMELIIVLVIALIIIGPKKLPEVGRSVGKGIREFKGSIAGDDHRDHADLIAASTRTVPAAGDEAADDAVAAPSDR